MFIALAILGLAVLIIVHEGGHFMVARLCGMRVDRFSIGFGPPLVKMKRGDTIYQVCAIPLGGYVQIAGLNPQDDTVRPDDPRAYPNRPVWQRLLTIFAGPGTNYVFAAVLMAIVFSIFGVPVTGNVPMIYQVSPDTPAATAGLEMGDEILSINHQPVAKQTDIAPIIEASKGAPISVEYRRGRDVQTATVKPTQMDGKWRVGISIGPNETFERAPVGKALVAGLVYPYYQTRDIFATFADMIHRKQRPDFTGPVGIVGQMKRQMARGAAEGFSVIAILSVYLGLFNLLPLPALDGGRLVFLAWEGVSRRRVNQRVEQMIHLVGMFALLGFMLYVTFFKDVPSALKH